LSRWAAFSRLSAQGKRPYRPATFIARWTRRACGGPTSQVRQRQLRSTSSRRTIASSRNVDCWGRHIQPASVFLHCFRNKRGSVRPIRQAGPCSLGSCDHGEAFLAWRAAAGRLGGTAEGPLGERSFRWWLGPRPHSRPSPHSHRDAVTPSS
jgi:hypothetical protein